jgi:proteasome assembly chaperone (PAC2) family protein
LSLEVNPDVPLMEHDAPSFPFDKRAAMDVFNSLSSFLNTKLAAKSFRAISFDTRNVLDQISEIYDEPPMENREFFLFFFG